MNIQTSPEVVMGWALAIVLEENGVWHMSVSKMVAMS
jgi:hypothetical protein